MHIVQNWQETYFVHLPDYRRRTKAIDSYIAYFFSKANQYDFPKVDLCLKSPGGGG